VPGHYIGRIEKDPSGTLRFLAEDDNRTSRSWYRLVDGKFEFIERQRPYDEDVVLPGRFGKHWTITTKGVTETTAGRSVFTPIDMSNASFRPNIFEDRDGGLWLGENRVHYVKNGELRTFGEKDGLLLNSIYHSFWQEQDGSVWFSSGGASSTSVGLVQIKNGEVHFWGQPHGLSSTSIQSIFNDREGTTWLATDRGLSRRRKQIIQGFSKKDGIDHSEIYPIHRDRSGTIWLGSTKGLSVYRNNKFETLDIQPVSSEKSGPVWRPGRMSVQSLWEDPSGKMWVGLNGGIFLVENGRAEVLLEGSHVFAIRNDRAGNVWAATNKGLLKFNDYKVTARYSTKDGLPNEFMTFIFEDSKGALWFGGYGGLSKFDDGRFTNYTVENGLVGNYVRTVYEDSDGAFWIGTYDEGMSRFKDGKFVNYSEKNGLFNNGAFAIEEDERGFFWISSNRGIYRVSRKELNDLADGLIAKVNSVGYGKEDGMLSTECNGGRQPASLRDEAGNFWFPTQDGVVKVDPHAEVQNPTAPTVVIEDVLSERESVGLGGQVAIEPGRKDLEIRYTGISLIKSGQVKFQYKLEGHDTDWIDAGTRRTAYYSFLPPGEYTFYVKAANSDGVWSAQAAALKIELRPFFYQTKLFLAVCAIGALLGLLIVWKISVYQMTLRERKLTKLVAERTDELAKMNQHLEQLANSDGLTKIGNRRRFESFLADEWRRAIRFKTPISLVLLDIDHFKSYNDTYGHQAGDDCLRKVAEAFADAIKRPTDLVARFGGEEFALVLGGTDAVGAVVIAEQAVQNVKDLNIGHVSPQPGSRLTVSVGIASKEPTLDNSEADLIGAADEALYQAKSSGRDRIYVCDRDSEKPASADILADDIVEAG
jgi:diguanylate cyclase (GGDEF)-like protein